MDTSAGEQGMTIPLPARFFIVLAALLVLSHLFCDNVAATPCEPPLTERAAAILAKVTPQLEKELAAKELQLGTPVFLRIFKMPGELEVWLKKDGRFRLFKSYSVCSSSGFPGPKTREGDWQSPEGFYAVTAAQMNPQSSYHLSFDIGYPNEYDQLFNRSGGNIMVHGSCSSMGCFAMTDYRIEEIYTLVHAALAGGQESVGVHVFPFPLTAANMDKFRNSPWFGFWSNLKEGYDLFETTGRVPEIKVAGGRYLVTAPEQVARMQAELAERYSLSFKPAKSSR
ncbi:MAG: L,D-transpeptidase family protein [Desulfobulbaceae bacterium]